MQINSKNYNVNSKLYGYHIRVNKVNKWHDEFTNQIDTTLWCINMKFMVV